jgi:hypothetical protein
VNWRAIRICARREARKRRRAHRARAAGEHRWHDLGQYWAFAEQSAVIGPHWRVEGRDRFERFLRAPRRARAPVKQQPSL